MRSNRRKTSPFSAAKSEKSVAQRVDRSRDPAASGYEIGAGFGLQRDYRRIAEKSAEFGNLTDALPVYGNDPDSGGLVIHNTDRDLIGNNTGYRACLGVTGDSYHIESYGANGSHRLKLFKAERV